MEELQDPPELITPMLKDEVWVDKFKIHFGNTRYQEKKKNPKKKREEKKEKKRKNKWFRKTKTILQFVIKGL